LCDYESNRVFTGMRQTQCECAQANLFCPPRGFAGELNSRFAVIVGHDLDFLPRDAIAMLNARPEHFAHGFFRGKARRELMGTAATVRDFHRGEHARQKPFAIARNGYFDTINLDQIDAAR
jgi:hypothetical protein